MRPYHRFARSSAPLSVTVALETDAQVHRHCLERARFITKFSEVSTLDKKKEKEKKRNLKVHRQCLERLRFTFPSMLEADAFWFTVTAFKGSGSSPFSARFQRWTKKKKKKRNLKVHRQCLERLRLNFPSMLETDSFWFTVTAF